MRSNLEDVSAIGLFVLSKLALGNTVRALEATLTLTVDDTVVQLLDPSGATKIVLLPTIATAKGGKVFIIWNKADAAEDLTIKDSTNTTTILTISQNEAGILFCDDTSAWHRVLLNAAAT